MIGIIEYNQNKCRLNFWDSSLYPKRHTFPTRTSWYYCDRKNYL